MKKKSSSLLKIGAGLAAASTALCIANYYWLLLENGQKIKVPAYTAIRVIDGDTFETAEKQKVRLSSADAPELDTCGGPEAKKALEDMIMGKPLFLKIVFTDQYGRFLSLVYTDKIYVNEAMIRKGYAYYLKDSTSVGDTLKKASDIAREKKVGIFSKTCTQVVNTEHPNCNIKGNTRNGKFYFTPECGRYNDVDVQLYLGDQWFCSEKEAKEAGFVPPSQCR
jgi:endonuclease YncB( thermonuclease family)